MAGLIKREDIDEVRQRTDIKEVVDGYVTLKTWWKVGAVVSVVNLIIWTTVGFGWWKLIGIW